MATAFAQDLAVPTAELRSLFGRLSFSTVVPRQLVHRRTLSEVLLTDWGNTVNGYALCAAQWSRSHRIYRVHNGVHDTLLLAETLRQAGILVSHDVLEVPGDYRFVMDRIAFEGDPIGLVAGCRPADVTLKVDISHTGRRTPSVVSFQVVADFFRDNRWIGRGTGWARCLAPRLYQRLRGRGGEVGPVADVPPVDVAEVGMCVRDDVVIGTPADQRTWPLRVQPQHPVLFDHPLDHVPGMLVLEGMRQVGRALCGWPQGWIAAADIRFKRFVELDSPSWVRVDSHTEARGQATFEMSVVQDSAVAAASTFKMLRLGTASGGDDGLVHFAG